MPVILMSGNVDDEIRMQARDAGANAVLRKPFSQDELIPMVEGLLPGRAESTAPEAAASQPQTVAPKPEATPTPTPAAVPEWSDDRILIEASYCA